MNVTTQDLDSAEELAKQELYTKVRRCFLELEESEGLTYQELANRLTLKRSQISRWMLEPSNMTIGSAAKLLRAMGNKLEFGATPPCLCRTSHFS